MITLINDDFRRAMPRLDSVCMVFADPPDNLGLKYADYKDKLTAMEYANFLRQVIWLGTAACDVLWISYNSRHTCQMGHLAYEFLVSNTEWEAKSCVQTFTFGQARQTDLGNNHRPLLRLMRTGTRLYPDAIRVPSWRQLNGDKRADPRGRVPGDVITTPQVTRELLPIPTMSLSDIQRLLAKIRQKGGADCWEWTGTKTSGYGRFRVGGRRGKVYTVTRLMWRLTYGTDPVGQLVLHKCDNPGCCNPAHLFLGTEKDNSDDKVAKGRQYHPPVGELNLNTTLTESDVLTIYQSTDSPRDLAAQYGVTDTTVRNIKSGKTWAHVTRRLQLSDVFDFPRVTGNSRQRRKWHPTQLNEGLYERCIRLTCGEGDTACDMFGGTGTMARACATTGNPCILIEQDASYCEEIAKEHGLLKTDDLTWEK